MPNILGSAFDLGTSLLLYFLLQLCFGEIPLFGRGGILWAFAFTAVLWIAQDFLLGATLGRMLWRNAKQPLAQSLAAFLTLSSLLAAVWLCILGIALHPVGLHAEADEWPTFFPGAGETARWNVSSFYYSLGAWPNTVASSDVLYSIPYQKGPPQRFAGEVFALWGSSEIKLTLEGPKSPQGEAFLPIPRGEIRQCVLDLWSPGSERLKTFLRCFETRRAVLWRHYEAMKKIHPQHWRLRWIQVASPTIPREQQLQGIYFSAWNETRAQERFILITPKGTEQAFVFDRPMNDAGEAALALFQNALRSVRVSDDLSSGKAWIDQQLTEVNLKNDSSIRELLRIQGLLIARITVDPKDFDTYFHLGGTALMLCRYAEKLRKLPPPDGNPDRATELISVAKPIVFTALKYAEDVSPQNPRLKLMQEFWTEAQKL